MVAKTLLFVPVGLCVGVMVLIAPIELASAADLNYPEDCDSKTLRREAEKGGCTVQAGGSHWKVYKDENLITTIPHSVKENNTCRAIIRAVNKHCDD